MRLECSSVSRARTVSGSVPGSVLGSVLVLLGCRGTGRRRLMTGGGGSDSTTGCSITTAGSSGSDKISITSASATFLRERLIGDTRLNASILPSGPEMSLVGESGRSFLTAVLAAGRGLRARLASAPRFTAVLLRIGLSVSDSVVGR